MIRRTLVFYLVFLVMVALTSSAVFASSPTSNLRQISEQTLAPGNYCISCHLSDDAHLTSVTTWNGGIAREVNSPCPAAEGIHKELYYTERLMLMIDRANIALGGLPEKNQSRLDDTSQRYSRMLDVPVSSLDVFMGEAQTTRFQLNKIYSILNNLLEASKQRTVLAYAGFVTLVLLISLAWGFYNTRFIKPASGKLMNYLKPAVFVLVVLAFFTLPILRIPPAVIVETTTQQQEAQATLDTADRSATASDRAQARALMLARLGAIWNGTDQAQAQTILDESLVSVTQVEDNNNAMWGQSFSVQEAMIGIPIDMEKANLIASDLNAARARLWSLPLIAVEWNAIDPVHAAEILQAEQNQTVPQSGIYRDLQMRGIALAWAEIQPSQAVNAARLIDDALLQTWTLRELAVITNQLSVFDLAADAARMVNDPVQRSRSLYELAVASGKASFFNEALVALDGVKGIPLAYALGDLAAAAGDTNLVERIDLAFPDARTSAYLRLGEYQAAWDAALGIIDPYERARAQASIAGDWENADAAMQIEINLYRDLALRNIIRNTGNATLTGSIQSSYYKVQAFTILDDYAAAVDISDQLGNKYPLIELVSVIARDDPQTALLLTEEMGSEADKAIALRVIAALTDEQSIFEQAQRMALAARVLGDALAPSQASLDLANQFWEVNAINARSALRQAYEAAQRVSIK